MGIPVRRVRLLLVLLPAACGHQAPPPRAQAPLADPSVPAAARPPDRPPPTTPAASADDSGASVIARLLAHDAPQGFREGLYGKAPAKAIDTASRARLTELGPALLAASGVDEENARTGAAQRPTAYFLDGRDFVLATASFAAHRVAILFAVEGDRLEPLVAAVHQRQDLGEEVLSYNHHQICIEGEDQPQVALACRNRVVPRAVTERLALARQLLAAQKPNREPPETTQVDVPADPYRALVAAGLDLAPWLAEVAFPQYQHFKPGERDVALRGYVTSGGAVDRSIVFVHMSFLEVAILYDLGGASPRPLVAAVYEPGGWGPRLAVDAHQECIRYTTAQDGRTPHFACAPR